MNTYRSKPNLIEAVQHLGNFDDLSDFAGDKVRINQDGGGLELLAGKDGTQQWVPVPIGHWLARTVDRSDYWPIEPKRFATVYELCE